MIDHWIEKFPLPQKEAIIAALGTASLAKTRRAMQLLEELDATLRGRTLKIEILSTYNLEPVLPFLSFALSCLPAQPHLQLAPLDSLETHILQSPGDPAELLDARIVNWRVEEVIPELLFPFSHGFPKETGRHIGQVLERVEGIVRLHQRQMPGVPLFISTIPTPLHFSNSVFSAQHTMGLSAAVGAINQKIHEISSEDAVYVLDIARWAAVEGSAQADVVLDFFARQPFSASGQISLSFFIARTLRPLIVPRRKVLAVDLDGTLWGGIVGEDGIESLKIGHDFPGNVHLRIQRELVELRERGILLVLISKNNETDARRAFESLPDMLIKWDDFVVRKVDWNHKHENLHAAAKELGVALDSFALIDDSDYEREQMRQLIPEVLVLNKSSDPLEILRSLWQTDAFDSLTVTEEDRRRHKDYLVRRPRSVDHFHGGLEAFLKSLEMQAAIEEISAVNLDRVVIMLGKTNQFNVTTRRHSRSQVQAMLNVPGSIGLALRLRDKFGDQGIVGLVLAVPGDRGATLVINSFLVSCRALSRGVEDALWSAMLEKASRHQIKRVEAEYIRTKKNALVADLYDRLGLRRTYENGSVTSYVLEPLNVMKPPSWISVKQ